MRKWGLVGVLAGCYAPSVPTGAPCETDRDCPSSLVCAASRTCQHPGTTCTDCDAAVDAPEAGCWDVWRSGTVTLGPPVIVGELSGLNADSNPSLADGDRRIYLTRVGLTGTDVFSATRSSATGTFSIPLAVLELSSLASDSRFTESMDGTIGVLASDRMGTVGMSDLWYTTRGGGGLFVTPTQQVVAALDDADQQFDPELAASGLALYYSHASGMTQHLMSASRTSTVDAFGAPAVIPITGAMPIQADPSISPDERVLVFASGTSGADTDLYYVTRASAGGAFGPAKLLDINSTSADSDPELSADGCRLYFSSNRAPAQNRDIWVSEVVR